MSIAPGCFSAHFSIEYRTHFTHFHATQVGMIGATEQLILVELGHLAAYFALNSNDYFQTPIDCGNNYTPTISRLLV